MFRSVAVVAFISCLTVLSVADLALCQVGDPVGTFNITIRQGRAILADQSVTIGPGGDLGDLKPIGEDGTPESFVQIGTLARSSPIILKVTSDGGPDESLRILHWYIDAPVSLSDIYTPGPDSLFYPLGGNIEVSISGLQFSNAVVATPLLVDNNTYLTSFMRDWQGHFYESPQANAFNAYGYGIHDIQVPGERYLDSDTSMYTFSSTPGASCSWTWGEVVTPGLLTSVNDGTTGGLTPLIPGYVFELGMSVAFAAVPEPATLALFLGLFLLHRRR